MPTKRRIASESYSASVSVAAIIAVAANTDGRREIVGLHIGPSEAETFWSSFLKSLSRRGLRGVKLVISDAHRSARRDGYRRQTLRIRGFAGNAPDPGAGCATANGQHDAIGARGSPCSREMGSNSSPPQDHVFGSRRDRPLPRR